MVEIGLLGAFLGGVLSLLSPCSALLLPSFFAYAFDGAGRLALRTAIFLAGLATVLVPLGAGVGAVGALLVDHRQTVTMVGAGLLIVFGVMAIIGRGFTFRPADRARSRISVRGNLSVYGLGAVYGFAGFCSGPLLGSVLTVAMWDGRAAYGGLLMGVYSVGMAAPLFVLALLWDRFDLGARGWLRGRELRLGPLRTHTTALVSGLLFIGIGVLFLLTDGTAGLGGPVGVDTQFDVESSALSWADRFSDLTVVLIAVLLIIAVLAWRVIAGIRRSATGDDAAPTAAAAGQAPVPATDAATSISLDPRAAARTAVQAGRVGSAETDRTDDTAR